MLVSFVARGTGFPCSNVAEHLLKSDQGDHHLLRSKWQACNSSGERSFG
jgi:hypothetical protein